MKSITIMIWICFMMLSLQSGIANIYIIPGDFTTIQEAIIASSDGDTILVKPGIYYETINFTGKKIVVGSYFITTSDSGYIAQTIIDGENSNCVVIFENNETYESELCGFTLRNGNGNLVNDLKFGGAIYCQQASPRLNHLIISGNNASGIGSGCGGGAYFKYSEALMESCVVENNSAYYGAGIRADFSNLILDHVIIRNNGGISAGGIHLVDCETTLLNQVLITGNQSIYGGGMAVTRSNPILNRVTFYQNMGLYGGSINIGEASNLIIVNSILWENTLHPENGPNEIYLSGSGISLNVAFSDILGGTDSIHIEGNGTVYSLEGNINQYPEFKDTSLMQLTLAETSPCINSGTANLTVGDEVIINLQPDEYSGTAPDMGAFEFDDQSAIENHEYGNFFFNSLIFPNPAENNLFISIPDHSNQGNIQLKIFNQLGKKVLENNIAGTKANFDISGLPSGLFLIVAKFNQKQYVHRFVKE